MTTYCSTTGAPVLVIHYPVARAGSATDDALPPVMIGPAPAQSGSDTWYAYTVYEPYADTVSHAAPPVRQRKAPHGRRRARR